ncbi:kinase-like domain-containing protein [Suillus lakei]|nr:kinase-like domain-containing protein [Suillus lakei]
MSSLWDFDFPQFSFNPLCHSRMADKIGQFSQPQKESSQPGLANLPYTPMSHSISVAADYHRGSISTQRTSSSEWTQQETISSRDVFTTRACLRGQKASTRLTDFIIQRTLGKGSLADQHPFIINLWARFRTASNLFMVMDFVPGGELFTLLRRSNRFPDPVAKFYAAEVALALNHLHSLDIIYRDLKPENILLNHDGHIKIADFGFSKHCSSVTWTLCGTPDYLAPEIIGQQRYNKSVDWYALGVLIFEMLSGLPPYHQPDHSPVVLYEKITRGPVFIRWPPFHENATDIIKKLMEGEPSKRYGNLRHGAGDVFAHPWFREVDWDKLRNREITAPYLPKIAGDGDASAFEQYPEDNVASMYGLPAQDTWGQDFPNFEYTNH